MMKLKGYKYREKTILVAMIDLGERTETYCGKAKQKAIDELQGLKSDINYIKSIDSHIPYQLAWGIDGICTIITEHIKRTR